MQSVTGWLPYTGGVFAGGGASVIALGLFLDGADDNFLYIAGIVFTIALLCWLLAFLGRNRRTPA